MLDDARAKDRVASSLPRRAATGASMTISFRTIGIGAAMSLAFATQAYALNTRTWISGHGIDQAGCGPIATPCRTLQYAHDNTTAKGEIDVLDPAGYGSVIIRKSIAIINDGVGVAGVLAAQTADAIRIQVGAADKVILRGLTIEGAGIGSNGIDVLSQGTLTVDNCFIHGFVGGSNSAGNGILIAPDSGTIDVVVTNTKITNNDYIGVSYLPGLFARGGNVTGKISVDHTTVTYSKLGIAAYTAFVTGASRVSIANTFVGHNVQTGVQMFGYNAASTDRFTALFVGNVITDNNPGIDLDGYGSAMFINTQSFSNDNLDIHQGANFFYETAKNNYYNLAKFDDTSKIEERVAY